jgi:pyridoxal phosphate enzyme (YggS family)
VLVFEIGKITIQFCLELSKFSLLPFFSSIFPALESAQRSRKESSTHQTTDIIITMVMIRHSKAVYALTSCLLSPLHVPTSCEALRTIGTTAAFTGSTTTRRRIKFYSTTTRRNMSSGETPTAAEIEANLADVKSCISQTIQECNLKEDSVRLIAVSKTKPMELLMNVYDAGQRYFGENYAQELIEKAEQMPSDIKWHFIGPLQSNKAAPLVKKVGLKKLACIETVSTMKLANKLNNAVTSLKEEGGDGANEDDKLGIYIQANTSGEESKSGLNSAKECAELASEISSSCPHIKILGLMTIGAPGDYSCFDALVECRKEVADALSVDVETLELSMGMSGDYQEAIKRGATSVRVGSTIFGARDYSKKK